MLLLTLSASLVEAFLTASVLSAAAEAAQAPSWARRQSRGRSSEHWLPCAWRRTRQAGLKPLMAYGLSWAIPTRLTSRVLASMKSPWCGWLACEIWASSRRAWRQAHREYRLSRHRGSAPSSLRVAPARSRGDRPASHGAPKWRRVHAADRPRRASPYRTLGG